MYVSERGNRVGKFEWGRLVWRFLAQQIQKCCENASGLRYDEIWHVPSFAASVI